MSSTITIGPNEISPNEIIQIFKLRTSNPSRLWQLAQKANYLAVTVEDRWKDITDEKRDLLAALVYDEIDPPSGIKDIFHIFVNHVYLVWYKAIILFQSEQDALIAYYSACKVL